MVCGEEDDDMSGLPADPPVTSCIIPASTSEHVCHQEEPPETCTDFDRVAPSDNGTRSVKVVSGNGSFRRRYARARKDWNQILASGSLVRTNYGRTNRSEEDIKAALRIILSSETVQYLSWGVKIIQMPNGTKKDFPGLSRKKDPEAIYRAYIDKIGNLNNGAIPLSRSVLLSLVSLATKRQQHRKSAADYVLGTLCYDTMGLLRQITNDLIEDAEQKELFISRLYAMEEFLKFTFMEHVDRDNDGFHDVSHALNVSSKASGVVSCKECLSSFAITTQLFTHQQLSSTRPDAVVAVKECEKKIQLFMAHQIRVSVQKKRITEVLSTIQMGNAVERVLLLMDFKMKFEPIVYREKTVDFFGKRGLSWHGIVAFYSDGAGEMRHLYLDQIVGNNSKKDKSAVVSLYDAALARIKREIPTAKYIYVLSDNARCYQNNLGPAMLPFITSTHGLHLMMLLHSQTQDGKSLVDAHFAVAMMHVCRYVDQGNR